MSSHVETEMLRDAQQRERRARLFAPIRITTHGSSCLGAGGLVYEKFSEMLWSRRLNTNAMGLGSFRVSKLPKDY